MSKYKGFSLIELLIAITVIFIGLISILSSATYSLSISKISVNEIVAVNLASEGIEVVRNVRDSNWLRGSPWDQWNIDGETDPNNNYFLHIDNTTDLTNDWIIHAVGGGPLAPIRPKVYYDSTYHYYGQRNPPSIPPSWQETPFARVINITNISAEEVRVVSTVNWTDQAGNHSVSIVEYLYNWKP